MALIVSFHHLVEWEIHTISNGKNERFFTVSVYPKIGQS
jgi:hypothetical protein